MLNITKSLIAIYTTLFCKKIGSDYEHRKIVYKMCLQSVPEKFW